MRLLIQLPTRERQIVHAAFWLVRHGYRELKSWVYENAVAQSILIDAVPDLSRQAKKRGLLLVADGGGVISANIRRND